MAIEQTLSQVATPLSMLSHHTSHFGVPGHFMDGWVTTVHFSKWYIWGLNVNKNDPFANDNSKAKKKKKKKKIEFDFKNKIFDVLVLGIRWL